MWELVVAKIDAWVTHWGSIVFSPKAHFRSASSTDLIRPGEFFLGAQFMSVFLSFAACIVFFAIYFQGNLIKGIQSDTDKALIASMGTVLFVGLSFITAVLTATCSFGVSKATRSRASYGQHLGIVFQLSALDAPVAAAVAVSVLFEGAKFEIPVLTIMAIVLVFRVWYLYAGYWGMERINSGTKGWRVLSYCLGFGIGFLLFNLCLTGIVWLFVLLMIGGFDP